ncbi:hypothetical protein [Sorangium cellulosum]|uniref:hypothetical protein n=1 Tax=Sorangium cellulosum TaxID=56 RepID=UPI0012FF91EA|nr:hypothetical protein [Sorangium cellulosum]
MPTAIAAVMGLRVAAEARRPPVVICDIATSLARTSSTTGIGARLVALLDVPGDEELAGAADRGRRPLLADIASAARG